MTTAPPQQSSSKEFWKFILIVVFIVVPIRFWVAEPFIVSGDSMYPTFKNHNYLIIDALSYRFKDPQRYDVIVFKYPLDTKRYFIKRIIGLPGETVTIKNKVITITSPTYPEGLIIDQPVLDVETSGNLSLTLKDDEFFVMGDNRTVSSDSRVWGPLKSSLIVGKPLVRLYPFTAIDLFPGQILKNQ